MTKPIEYGELACKALMHMYKPEDLPPKGVLFYHQGVFLSGMQNVYLLTEKKEYFDYIKTYVDSVIGEDGSLIGFDYELNTDSTPDLAKAALTMLDHKQPIILFYNLYDETGDEKYKKAIDTIAESMHFWPVNKCGGYWHMMTQHNQMWMDGAYMAGPLSVMYDARFGDKVLRERAINQIIIMNEHIRDDKTGLYFHGWDESKEAPWADKETGLSKEIWGRAVGWYAVAILDILEYIPKDHPKRKKLEEIETDLLESLLKFQDEKTGMWYEVVDKPERSDNWVESSCTNLFIYSFAKAIRTGVVSGERFENALKKAYDGIVSSLYYDEDGYLVIDDVCCGTCIDEGTYEHYINRPKIKNDLHGAGAFILMCAEVERYERSRKK